MTRVFSLLAVSALVIACGSSQPATIAGTTIPDTPENQAIVDRVEEYRMAMERQDAQALVLMAAESYREQAQAVGDDYGYDGLLDILRHRLRQVEDVRYSLDYKSIRHEGERAHVEVLIDASYTIEDARGEEVRRDMQDQNEFILEWSGERWMFVSGM